MQGNRVENPCRMNLKGMFTPADLITAAATYLALSIDLNEHSVHSLMTNLVSSFEAFRFERIFLFFAFLFVYSYIRKKCEQDDGSKKTRGFLALLFSFFMVFGKSFELTDSWRLIFTVPNGQVIKALVMFAGYTALFYHLTALAFRLLDRGAEALANGNERESWTAGRYPGVIRWYLRSLQDRPFLTLFLTLLIASVPNLVMSYPARFMGDTRPQIVQAYRVLQDTGFGYLTPDHLLKENVFINQHHPVVHTVLIHACLVVGDAVGGSLNAGIFLYILLQAVVLMASFAYAGTVAVRKTGISAGGMLAVVGYALIHPHIANYMFLVTKDTIYSAFLLLYVICLYRILAGEKGRRLAVLTGLGMAGMILFRNEGRYVLILFALLAVLIRKETRKQFLCMLLLVVLFSAAVFRVLFPALGFTPGSRREMLSIPFQQTARYVRDHGNEVTEEEREAIDRVLDYQAIAEKYKPDISDDVKATFREQATGEDLADYFRAWAGMLLKHPGTYIQATMNNYYQYFYPGEKRINYYSNTSATKRVNTTNKKMALIGKRFSLPDSTARLRKWYDKAMNGMKKIPGFDILFTAAFYSWTVILFLFWAARRKNRKGCVLFCLPAVIYGVCLLSPCNGYYNRYQYPVMLIIPFIILAALQFGNGSRADRTEIQESVQNG